MPRRVPQEINHAELDADVATQRARQVELRLRCCVPLEGDQWRKIRKACDAAKELEPADRLAALLDLADELRPVLPAAVVENNLPSFEGWRP
jgi:hypothetical protein